MMIEYREIHEFDRDELQDLFLSVGWSSGHYPDRLSAAMKGFETVVSAWDGGRLTGMICAMDDGSMTAYIHYLLVRPEYQGAGVGKALVERVKEIYRDYLRIVVVSYDEETGFYENCGFEKASHASAMFITGLWT